MRRPGVIAPDNVQCCDFYKNIGNKTDEEIYDYVIGSETFDKEMQYRLDRVLNYRQYQNGGERGNVLEVMAGNGRNEGVLGEYFKDIEMLE